MDRCVHTYYACHSLVTSLERALSHNIKPAVIYNTCKWQLLQLCVDLIIFDDRLPYLSFEISLPFFYVLRMVEKNLSVRSLQNRLPHALSNFINFIHLSFSVASTENLKFLNMLKLQTRQKIWQR